MLSVRFVDFQDGLVCSLGLIEIHHIGSKKDNDRKESKAASKRRFLGGREASTDNRCHDPVTHRRESVRLAARAKREKFSTNHPHDRSPTVGKADDEDASKDNDDPSNCFALGQRGQDCIGNECKHHDNTTRNQESDTSKTLNCRDGDKGRDKIDKVQDEGTNDGPPASKNLAKIVGA